MMQYPPGTPQQSISQAMQWMQPHASQRVPRRQMADMKEVQHRALAKLHMAPAAVPDQLGPEGAAAVQRRRALLEAHDELERAHGEHDWGSRLSVTAVLWRCAAAWQRWRVHERVPDD